MTSAAISSALSRVANSHGSGDPVPHHSDYPLPVLLAAKGARTVSVCIPARNEQATVGQVVRVVRDELMDATGLVDELLVLDHASTDRTAEFARAAGAGVVSVDDVLPQYGSALGKGDVLWRSVAASRGDVIVWLDADLEQFRQHYVTGLLGPMLCEPTIALTRATYDRALGGAPGEGGRVTELLARPVISMLFPELDHIRQPLGGEYAIRRDVAESLAFEPDYGVEMGLLLDVAAEHGVAAIAQVDLGERVHRNRPLTALREQSRQVLRAVLSRTPTAGSVRGALPMRPPLTSLRSDRLVAV